MQTAATSSALPTNYNRDDFEERMSPELFQFTKVGDALFGTLREMNDCTIKDKPGVEYIIEATDRIVKVFQTYDLKMKLFRKDLNKKIMIELVGEDKEAGGSGNAMKVFRVVVGKKPVE